MTGFHNFMETAPPQIISVEKSPRPRKFETILEESIGLVEDWGLRATSLLLNGEIAPAPVIEVEKLSYNSTLDTIWEETIHYAENFVSEAADIIFRPARRMNYWESLSNPFCIIADNLQDLSPAKATITARAKTTRKQLHF